MDQGTLQGIGTILAMVAFLAVCWWAYSPHKKKDFDEASQLPFVDDALKTASGVKNLESNEKRHG